MILFPITGCFLAERPKVDAYHVSLLPEKSYESPKKNLTFQQDYQLALQIVNDFAKKYKFELKDDNQKRFFQYYMSDDGGDLYFYYDARHDALEFIFVTNNDENFKLKCVATELEKQLAHEFENRVRSDF